ncbi:MAG: YbaN family protein [Gemmatimonadota bacterium]
MDPGLREPRDTVPDDVREHASPWVRGILIGAGFLCVALGVIGIFVPLLPTTPFMLLAAACFARGSRRFHDWLLANRTFGPLIHEWRRHRSIPQRTKFAAIALMAVTLTVSIVFFVRPAWLKIALALFGLGLAIWMYRIPSRPVTER